MKSQVIHMKFSMSESGYRFYIGMDNFRTPGFGCRENRSFDCSLVSAFDQRFQIVYSTCSLTYAQNEDVVEKFLSLNPCVGMQSCWK
ncbi:hypothetical protein L1987_30378 [Smallanthus sonchifolius]|uniref:Uncharacterized protein n=1 Tax=Smallanthus sonchifolius TaxID=185202 RepID=A0ACB9I3U3_9ASTR|nr:hypothetical protein L1987_30378 [Smallanthus sonchifolius]